MKVYVHGGAAIICMTETEASWLKILASMNSTIPAALREKKVLGQPLFTEEQSRVLEDVQTDLHNALVQGGVKN